MTTGIVLMTYGAPAGREDLPGYLTRVRGGKEPAPELVDEMARRYERIGGSPLVRITTAQAVALEGALGPGWIAAAGMRYSEPSIAHAAKALVARGARRLVGVVMSPQWSPLLMGGYARALDDTAAALGVTATVAGAWHRESAFIDDLAAAITEARAGAGGHVVLTAHSLPKRVYEAEPAYIDQLRETAEAVARRAGLGEWTWAYQSAGHTKEEWLRPDLTDVFPEIARGGHRAVVVAPVQFLADHLEVLYDLDIAAAEQAAAAGLRYSRVAMPNTRPSFITALADVARRAALEPVA